MRAREEEKLIAASTSTLTDSHGRFHNYLRVSLSERCNLRCTYCMPEAGVALQPEPKLLTTEEVGRLVGLFAAAGVNKLRLTGGEPLLRRDLAKIVRLSKGAGIEHVGITTNGITLQRHLHELQAAGLSHINISLDTLRRDRFSSVTRRNGFAAVMKGLEAAVSSGYAKRRALKINCVVMRGVNDDELMDFFALAKEEAIDVRFIEWMPFDDNKWDSSTFLGYEEMLQSLRSRCDLTQLPESDERGSGANDTTKWFAAGGHMGRIGFITSMSDHFCEGCNRLRITADGSLKVCLFGDESLSLRDAMRAGVSDDDLALLIRAAVRKKKAALGGHGDMHGIAASKNRPMTLIGG
jgi:molybdenum cofactor biosynthesis protein A